MKNFILYVILACSMQAVTAQTARVQVIHNSADAAAVEVDIYIDGTLALDDFAFRTASPYIDFPADVSVDIAVAPPGSTGVGDAIATFPVTLASGETYVVVADGIVSPSGYDPAPPFGLEVFDMGRETASNGANTDVLVHHGSTDAPTVDVVETGVGAGTIVDNASYTDFAGYLELPTADYVLEVRDETGTVTVATYQAPLATLGLDGAAAVVVASGFLDPSNNSNGEAFGLWVALPSGGEMIPLPQLLATSDFDSNSIAIYPNPSTDSINIRGLENSNYSFTIVDMRGRVLSNSQLISETASINISNLPTGIYQLMISEGNTVVGSKKFIKN